VRNVLANASALFCGLRTGSLRSSLDIEAEHIQRCFQDQFMNGRRLGESSIRIPLVKWDRFPPVRDWPFLTWSAFLGIYPILGR
jgi:hypothetical protein